MLVRGSNVVVMAPPGEVARLDAAEAEQFRSAIATAVEVAAAPAPGGSGSSEEIGMASTVMQYGDGGHATVAGRSASPSCRGGTTTPIPGSAAIPSLRGEAS